MIAAGKIVVDTAVFIRWIKTNDEEFVVEKRRLLRSESGGYTAGEPAVELIVAVAKERRPLSDVRKKFRDRATRLKRALANEQKKYLQIEDGAGKRYLIGPFYVLADELEKALAHYDWYEKHCSDDIGEPFHYLYWALALYRIGEIKKANLKLFETMLRNVYLLPILLGSRPDPYDIWHSSNRAQPDYITQTPAELLPQLSEQERFWIEEQFDSFCFRRAREAYVATYGALKLESNTDKRRRILGRWNEFWASSAKIDGDTCERR